jgi:hypothetical protein
VLKEVAAHSSCWAGAGPPPSDGKHAQTTAQRWRQVHDLIDKGTGLLECSRRLNLSLNTVKRYARAAEPQRMIRAPRYRATLVDPYRDHLRARRAADPAVPVWQLLAEIREQGYTGSMNLLYRYITQGRVEADRPHLSPRRVARLLLTRPENLSDAQRSLLAKLTAACPEMASLAELVGSFAALLTPDPGNQARLSEWISAARSCGLPSVHSFTRELNLDAQAAIAAVTLPYHNGRTEGVNTKTKMIKRQMYGRAGFTLLHHRILLALRHVSSPPEMSQSRSCDRPCDRLGRLEEDVLDRGAVKVPVLYGRGSAGHRDVEAGQDEGVGVDRPGLGEFGDRQARWSAVSSR